MIIFQVDIYLESTKNKFACTYENCVDCDSFKFICETIETLSLSYSKPVLVIHGDTNAYSFNQPSEKVPNLWHFNGPGDFKVLDADQVTFNPNESKKTLKFLGY